MTIWTRRELLDSGVGRGTIARRVSGGTLLRLLPEVYSTQPPTYADRCRAVLAWKPDAVLSHDSAAWIWGLLDDEPTVVHATVAPTGAHRSPPWVRLHRRRLTAVAYVDLLPVVTVEECFLDIALTMDGPSLERFVDRALSRTVRWRAVAQACDNAKGRHGVARVRDQLRRCCPRTLSEPERIVARALTRRNFRMEINAQVGRFYGDLVDRAARVIVEIDGREFHSTPYAFTNDRVRQNELVMDKWLVLRYSAVTVMARTDDVVDEIIAVVRRRRHNRAS